MADVGSDVVARSGVAEARSGHEASVASSRFVRRVAALPEEVSGLRREARAFAVSLGAADPDALALGLAEALNNVVLHAYEGAAEPGDVEVVVESVADDGVRVVVTDDGGGIRPRVHSPGAGLGMPIMASVSDEVDIEPRAGGGSRVSMRFAGVDEQA